MSEFRIGTRQRELGVARASGPTRAQGSPLRDPAVTAGWASDSAEIGGLGVLGALVVEGETSTRSGPHTLPSAVEAMERDMLHILDKAHPKDNVHLETQVSDGLPTDFGEDAHLERAREGDAAWLPLPLPLTTLKKWGSGKYLEALEAWQDGYVELNREIDAYVRVNDLTHAQVRSLLDAIVRPRSMTLVGEGSDFKEEDLRKKPAHETFGEIFSVLRNFQGSGRGFQNEIKKSMESLFGKDATASIGSILAGGARQLLDQEADRLGWVRHKDPDERKQELSLALLRLIGEVGRDAWRWPKEERTQWSKFVEKVRETVFEHPEKAAAALRAGYMGGEG